MGKTLVSASWGKRFSDYLVALPSLKKVRVQRIFSLVATELLQGQVQIQYTGVEESSTGTSFTREVWERGEFQPGLGEVD